MTLEDARGALSIHHNNILNLNYLIVQVHDNNCYGSFDHDFKTVTETSSVYTISACSVFTTNTL